ncbi:YicC/YloC family endoribonuclease [Wenzhouxiangella limi]|uniref:YicC family protein n=1 Tax=Wenzhouxiangella limi TaxID=2707351 RepID=A0A845V1V3_9GAMM|nr:YicC/YloC family endoribonuclease [Wenzhouxiangella limi]NDY94261.1 YicC family protein [Wenzhouxiangella limi]
MIRSMTAYAQRSLQTDRGQLTWELRSVNQRYLDLHLRLPEEFRVLEPQVRDALKQTLNRGKVEASLRFQPDPGAESAHLTLDTQLAQRLGHLVRDLAAQTGSHAAEPDLVNLLGWPGLVTHERLDFEREHVAAVELLGEALLALVAAREQEGAAIAAMIEERLAGIEQQVAEVRAHLPEIRAGLDQRLRERLAALEQPVDPGRIEQEVVLALQKLDVDEELDRLGVHVAEIRRVLGLDEPVGRRLDFLMQELNREANTLGSKAAVVETGQAAVELKVLIEQMREQIQNVE